MSSLTFHLFSSLPTELRKPIWQKTLNGELGSGYHLPPKLVWFTFEKLAPSTKHPSKVFREPCSNQRSVLIYSDDVGGRVVDSCRLARLLGLKWLGEALEGRTTLMWIGNPMLAGGVEKAGG